MHNIQSIRKIARKHSRGFTLVELMIVVAIIGVLAALAVYGVSKYVANAKSAEARSSLGAMAKGQIAAFNSEKTDATALSLGGTVGTTYQLCPSATATVPAAVATVKGLKYQSKPTEWNDPAYECLRFSMDQPQYFMYNFAAVQAGAAAAAGDTFTATATGDLDGDAITSVFTLGGSVLAEAGQVILSINPGIDELRAGE